MVMLGIEGEWHRVFGRDGRVITTMDVPESFQRCMALEYGEHLPPAPVILLKYLEMLAFQQMTLDGRSA